MRREEEEEQEKEEGAGGGGRSASPKLAPILAIPSSALEQIRNPFVSPLSPIHSGRIDNL